MSRDKSLDSAHVAFAMAVRRLELQHGVFIHTSPEWTFFASYRPRPDRGVFAGIEPTEMAADLEKEVDAEPRPQRLRS